MSASQPHRIGRSIAKAILYGLPVLLWMVVILVYSAGERGGYVRSLFLLQNIIIGLTPGFPYQLDHGMLIQMSMYQLNLAFRTLSHVVVYAVLAVLVVRLVQAGRTRLKPAAFVAALIVSVLYMGVDEWRRWHEPDRHAKPIDLFLNLIGVALVLGGTPLFFALKAWERRLAGEPDSSPSSKEN